MEYQSCLDPLDGFKVEGKKWPDETDEPAFGAYMTATYGLAPKEYPGMDKSTAQTSSLISRDPTRVS